MKMFDIERGDYMPAGYAHYIFGQKVLNALQPPYQQIIKNNIDLYNIGVHGPDILFYYNAPVSNKVKQQGNTMHQKAAYDFFKTAQNIIKSKPDEASIAYLYGFITHFVLDHSCHPYIAVKQRELDLTHSEIESELDRRLLVNNHLDPLRTSLIDHIHPRHEISKTIAPFFQLDDKTIYKSLKDLRFYLNWIKAPGKIKRTFVLLCMKAGGIYDEYHGLLISYEANQKCEKCIQELTQNLDRQVMSAKWLIETFMEQPLDDIYHFNFE